jgi:hypothetical protein
VTGALRPISLEYREENLLKKDKKKQEHHGCVDQKKCGQK